jgi:hypothetical protein
MSTRRTVIFVLCCGVFALSGCAWLDKVTGADGKSGGAGQKKSSIQVLEDTVGAVPLYGGIASSILGVFGTVYNGIRAKKLGTTAAVAQQEADEKGKMLLAVIDGVEDVKAQIEGGKYAEAINGLLRSKAAAYTLYNEIRAEVVAFRESP